MLNSNPVLCSSVAKSSQPINVCASPIQRQTEVFSKAQSLIKKSTPSKLKKDLLKEKQILLDNSPFKKYTNISQYNNLSESEEKKIQFKKAHQYYLNQAMIHKNLTTACGSLCWLCSKPCCVNKKTCSWIQQDVPVEGWKAEPSIITNSPNEIVNTYNILDCPKFSFDSSRSYELGDLVPILCYFNQVCARTVIRNPQRQINKYNELFPFAPLTLFEDIYNEDEEYEKEEDYECEYECEKENSLYTDLDN